MAEGVRVAEEALETGSEIEMAVVASEALDQPDIRFENLLKKLDPASLFKSEKKELDKALDSRSPQPIALICRKNNLALDNLKPTGKSMIVICDTINNPGNLGAIIRVAAAAGADGLVCTPGCADIYNPKCVRASAGAIFRLMLSEAENTNRIITFLKNNGYALYGAQMSGEDIFALESLEQNVAVLMGSEAFGAGDDLSAACSRKVRVPMANSVESLNVAVAAGVILYRFSLLMRD